MRANPTSWIGLRSSPDLALVDEIVEAHLDFERELLDGLRPCQQLDLAARLRTALLSLDDHAPS